MLSAGTVLTAVLIVGGTVWCTQVVRRLPSDWSEFRTSRDREDRIAIAAWWGVTAIVFLFTLGLAWPVALRLWNAAGIG